MTARSCGRAAAVATAFVAVATLGGCTKRADPPPPADAAPMPVASGEDDPQAWLAAVCARSRCVEWTEDIGGPIGVRREPRGRSKFCSVTRRDPAKDGGAGRVRWITLLGPGSSFYLDGTLMRVLACDYRYTPETDMHLVMTLLAGLDAECRPGDVCDEPFPWQEIP
jgi:hypothetical protein